MLLTEKGGERTLTNKEIFLPLPHFCIFIFILYLFLPKIDISCLAHHYNIYIVLDMGDVQPCNKTDSNCPDDGRYQYNTLVTFGPDGEVKKRDKIKNEGKKEKGKPKKRRNEESDFFTFFIFWGSKEEKTEYRKVWTIFLFLDENVFKSSNVGSTKNSECDLGGGIIMPSGPDLPAASPIPLLPLLFYNYYLFNFI